MENIKEFETNMPPIHTDLLRFVKRERNLAEMNDRETADFETDLIMAGRKCAIRFGIQPPTDYYSMDDVVLMDPSPNGQTNGAIFNCNESASFGFEIQQETGLNEQIKVDFYLVLKNDTTVQLITFKDCFVKLDNDIILGNVVAEVI
jgi:hypothetical protein